MKRRVVHLSVGLVLSAALIGLLVRAVEFDSIVQAMARIDGRFVVVAVAVHILAMYVRSVVWQRLLVVRLPVSVLFKASIVGFAVSYVMPLRIGEVARTYLLARWRGIPFGTTVASLVAERVLDGLAVGMILIVGIVLVPVPAWVTALGIVVGVLFGGLALLLMLVTWRGGATAHLAKVVARRLPARVGKIAVQVAHNFDEGLSPLRDWRMLPALGVLATIGWLLQFAVFYVGLLAMNIATTAPIALLCGAVANFATLLPSAPGNAGTFDAAIIKLLTDVQGLELAQAAAYAVVVHLVVVIPVITLGGLILWRSNLRLGQMLGPATVAQTTTRGSTVASAATATITYAS